MKKHLLSTSAIALGVAMAAPASAAEWDLAWGGFANVHVGATNIDADSGTDFAGGDYDGVDVYTNAEIIFSPSVTLDNGMTFGYSVQFEAMNGFSIDESYMTISSDTLGRVILGSENSAGYLAMGSVYTPGAPSMPINSLSSRMPIAPRSKRTWWLGQRQRMLSGVSGPLWGWPRGRMWALSA